MRRRLIIAALLWSVPLAALADDSGSVLVQTQMPRRGSAPAVVVAYGTAAPALDGGMTLSLQQDGRILGIDVTPGEAVRKGDKLIEFGASAAASSTYQQAVSAVALARSQRVHTAQLLGQQLATRDQLAQADKALSDAQSALDALQRAGGGRPEQSLAAPFDGTVATIPVAQGDRVQPGAPLLTLTRLDGLVVTVGIEPSERGRVTPGQMVRLDRLAGGAPLAGQVLRIDGVLNAKTRLVDADISVPIGAVLSGEAFRAAITVGDDRGWIVPHDAVLTGADGAYVFQVDGGKAVRVAVAIVGEAGNTDVVDGALDPKRALVVQGNYQLDDGAAVRDGSAP
jgi:membrane fusion protein, multidrug efflux system